MKPPSRALKLCAFKNCFTVHTFAKFKSPSTTRIRSQFLMDQLLNDFRHSLKNSAWFWFCRCTKLFKLACTTTLLRLLTPTENISANIASNIFRRSKVSGRNIISLQVRVGTQCLTRLLAKSEFIFVTTDTFLRAGVHSA